MKRVPIIPSLIVLASIGVMVALGIWQIQRAAWKEQMLVQLQANQDLPALDLDPLLQRDDAGDVPMAFRRVLVSCASGTTAPSLRAGRNAAGETGYSHFVPCRPGATGLAGRIEVDVGWTRGPDGRRSVLAGIVAGRTGTAEAAGPIILTAATPSEGLLASTPPSIDDIPNNHVAYAVQWFLFAGAAAVIYALVLLRRSRAGG